MTTDSLMKVESIWYFWPALSDNLSWKTFVGLFESGRFTQVSLYSHSILAVVPLSIVVMRNAVKTLTSFIDSGISGMYTISMRNQSYNLPLFFCIGGLHMWILHLLVKKKQRFLL